MVSNASVFFCLLGIDFFDYVLSSDGRFFITTDVLPSVSLLFALSSSSARSPEGTYTILLGCLFSACVLNRACFNASIDALIALSYLACSPSLDGLPGCRLFHRRLCRWPSVRRSPASCSSSASLPRALVRRGQLQPFASRKGRQTPGQMKMSMVWR